MVWNLGLGTIPAALAGLLLAGCVPNGAPGRPEAPTVLIASHRLSALRHTDLVLCFDRGRLVDVGRHAELVERPGVYRDTWLAQTARRETLSETAS